MKTKKTEVITFRTSPEVKKKLENEANKRDWTVSQLVERIISSYTKGTTTHNQFIIERNETINNY